MDKIGKTEFSTLGALELARIDHAVEVRSYDEALGYWVPVEVWEDLLAACRTAIDGLGCDRVRQDRLNAQRIIHAALAKAEEGE